MNNHELAFLWIIEYKLKIDFFGLTITDLDTCEEYYWNEDTFEDFYSTLTYAFAMINGSKQ